MMNIFILPLPESFLERVRVQGVDDQEQPVRRFRSAEGGEPCRDVLRRARPGEEMILASFCPHDVPGPYREFGPIFLLAEPASDAVSRHALPLPQGHPDDYFGPQVGVRAHNAGGDIVDGAVVPTSEAEGLARTYLAAAETAFVLVRLYTYGCFGCRVERAD